MQGCLQAWSHIGIHVYGHNGYRSFDAEQQGGQTERAAIESAGAD